MFTIENFEERWNNEFPETVEYDPEIVDGLEISEEAKNFLKKYGLPDEAPGCLIFKPFEDEDSVSLSSMCNGHLKHELILVSFFKWSLQILFASDSVKFLIFFFISPKRLVFLRASDKS